MRVVYVFVQRGALRGGQRSLYTQAATLAGEHDVEVVGVVDAGHSVALPDPEGVPTRTLVEVADDVPATPEGLGLTPEQSGRLHRRGSRHGSRNVDSALTALTDLALDAFLADLDADVLVTTSPGLLLAALGAPGRRYAIQHHERMSLGGRVERLELLRAFGHHVDGLVVTHEAHAAFLRAEVGPSCPPVTVLPDPVPFPHTPRSRLDSRLILVAGALEHHNHVGQIVKAFAFAAEELPGWRLRILGAGRQLTELEVTARRFELYDRVELPGESLDMAGEWAQASMAVVATLHHGAPLVITEAMAAGVPVVAYDSPDGSRLLIDDGVTGLLVPEGSLVALARALARLGGDGALRRSLGEAAVPVVAARLPHLLAKEWVASLEQVRERHVSGRPGPEGVGGTDRTDRTDAPLTEGLRSSLTSDPGSDSIWSGATPAEALARTVELLARLAARVAPSWFALRAHDGNPPVVVVPAGARDAFLAALGGEPSTGLFVLPAATTQPGAPTDPQGPVRRCIPELRRGKTPVLSLGPPPRNGGRASLYASGCQVDVEFWDETPRALVAPRLNPWTPEVSRQFSTVEVEVSGVAVPTLPLAATPTLADRPFPVDVVYTWVDGEDPAWGAARDDRLARSAGLAARRESSGRARFTARDELRYSMRSVHLFAPWVRHLYLVTSGQVPPWLDTAHPRVTLVTHAEIFADGCLPTFNSHAIEARLHHVPGLSEHFIYLNDDVFLARPHGPERFFGPAGQFATFASDQALGPDGEDDEVPVYKRAGLNNRRLLERDFGRRITHTLAHTAHPFRRSTLEELEARYPA